MVYTLAKPDPWNVSRAFVSKDAQRLWDGLVMLVPAWEGGGAPVEVITNTPLAPVGGQEWAHGPRGMSLYSDDVTTNDGGWTFQPNLQTHPSMLPVTTAVTVVIHKRKRDGTNRVSSAFGVIIEAGQDAQRCGAHVPFSDGTVYWDFGGTTGGTSRLSVAGLSFGDDVWCFDAGYRGMEIWQNGVLVASQAGHATRTLDGDNFSLGNGNTDNTSPIKADNAEYAIFALWDRQLDIEDCRRLTLDPWPLIRYAPETKRVFLEEAPPEPEGPADPLFAPWYGTAGGPNILELAETVVY